MLSQNALTWIGFAVAFLTFAGQWVDPANAKTPWSWSGPARASAFAILSFVTGVLQHVVDAPNAPWIQSVITALLILGPALIAHFAHSIPISGSASGGGTYTPGQSGFVHGRLLVGLAIVTVAAPLIASACKPAQTKAGIDLALCAEDVATQSGAPKQLIDLVALIAVRCSAQEAEIIASIVSSRAPALAAHHDEADAILHDVSKMNDLKASVAVRLGRAR